MGNLTALELLILIVNTKVVSDHSEDRFTHINKFLIKKLRDEFLSREDGERRAAMQDIKRIDPETTEAMDMLLVINDMISRFKRQQ